MRVPSRGVLGLAVSVSGAMKVLVQAARSIVQPDGGWPRLCQPSTLRMVIWPEASRAQNSIAAVSALGSTVCVLMRRLNSSCSRSIALVVRADFHYNKLMPWDHAAGWLLHREAGGHGAHFDGSAYRPTHLTGGLICAPDAASWRLARDALLGRAGRPS